MQPVSGERTETATLTQKSAAVQLAPSSAPERARRIPRRLVASWHFTRHFLEMVVAMVAGMVVLGVAVEVFGAPPGYANPLVESGLMGVAMTIPMVGWMRYRGHPWSDGMEMTAAMLLPMFALVLPVALGLIAGHSFMMLAHVAMLGGMLALMLYRRDRYTHG